MLSCSSTRRASDKQSVISWCPSTSCISPHLMRRNSRRILMDELPERLKHDPITFRLKAQLAAAGDSTKDPSVAWPDDRKVAELGVLTVDKVVPDSAEAEKKLLFLPGQLTDGIEESDDPLIDIRDGAYALSFSRRNP